MNQELIGEGKQPAYNPQVVSTKASFRQIGRGTCRTVFERPGATFVRVLKLAKTDSDAL
jgi:hypothetical protein